MSRATSPFTSAAAIILVLAMAGLASAQTYIEPTAPPPGGRSATYLDVTDTQQEKLGSLIIGTSTSTAKLCLNSLNSAQGTNYCISAWGDLTAPVGGPFVKIHSATFSATPALPSSYTKDSGYMRLIGNGLAAKETFITTNNNTFIGGSGPPPTTEAAYASDNGVATNYAASFYGKLKISYHINQATGTDDLSSPGQICLGNTNYPASGTPRLGCIQNWTDLPGATNGPYVKLQTINPPDPQYTLDAGVPKGSAGVDKAWQFGSVVLGLPFNFTTPFCGDGLCSSYAPANETNGTCPADCPGAPPAGP